MKKMIILLIMLFTITACEENTNTSYQSEPQYKQESETFRKGKRQLEVQGYVNIKEISYPLFCCAEEDSFLFSTGFEAEDKNGEKIEGCFCVKGIFRNSVTIRFK